MYYKNKSFTLIEMLIVIVIIGILASALVPRLVSLQARARDSKRNVDMTNIYTALKIYHLDNNYVLHPATYGGNDTTPTVRDISTSGGFIVYLISGGYMTTVPVDPINTYSHYADVTGTYFYLYGCTTGSSASSGLFLRYNSETLQNSIAYTSGLSSPGISLDKNFNCY